MKSLTDLAVSCVLLERIRQNHKWGDQSHLPLPTWFLILSEEVGELSEAILETELEGAHPERGGLENIREEAIQVAAVATALVETLIKREGEKNGNQEDESLHLFQQERAGVCVFPVREDEDQL